MRGILGGVTGVSVKGAEPSGQATESEGWAL